LVTWKTTKIRLLESGEMFFFRINKINNIFSMEVVMLGSEEECRQHKAEVSAVNPDTKEVVIKSIFNPRPISATNSEDLCLSVKQTSLSKFWRHDQEAKKYLVSICVQIHTI